VDPWALLPDTTPIFFRPLEGCQLVSACCRSSSRLWSSALRSAVLDFGLPSHPTTCRGSVPQPVVVRGPETARRHDVRVTIIK
jgi:hypothetical protein